MTTRVRVKFRCISETRHATMEAKTVEFMAMYDPELHKYTPSGSMKLTVDNPNVQFEVGAYYYLDFTKVED